MRYQKGEEYKNHAHVDSITGDSANGLVDNQV